MEDIFVSDLAVIHSNKTQNYRIRSIENFNERLTRILITTDIMARGLDLDLISHVINFDTPSFPENYMHRIGRTGRAEQKGRSLLFYTDKERSSKEAIEKLMGIQIPLTELPSEIEISKQLTYDEQPKHKERYNPLKEVGIGKGFHEKKDKNKKENLGGSYKRTVKKKYKKPKTKGDKNFNKRNKK